MSRSPQAIAIDGRWGTGKSTFLALWTAYLRQKGVKVVQFNAWKAFGADPFNALTREILRQVDVPSSERPAPHKRIVKLLNRYAPVVAKGTRLISMFQPEHQDVLHALATGLESTGGRAGHRANDTSDVVVDSLDVFTSLLSSAANEWSDQPIVVMVDELDRCNPEYSVEMLQLLEHVFHAKGVVFVVAMNQSDLIHSIRAFYGLSFNAEGYLERFFDDILPLPASNRPQFIRVSLSPIASANTSSVLAFLEPSNLSLRQINKSIEKLRSVLEIRSGSTDVLLHLWLAQILAPHEYRQFILGASSDKALAEAIFSNGNCARLRIVGQKPYNYSATRLEAILILGSSLLPRGTVSRPHYQNPDTNSELYQQHKRNVDNSSDEPSIEYSQLVLSQADNLSGGFEMELGGWQTAVLILDREASLS